MRVPLTNIHIGRKAPGGSHGVQLRPNNGQGPYTAGFRRFIAQKLDPAFFEFMREAIPIMDAAIWRLVSLDGHLVVRGDNAALVDEIQDWMDNVPVNDFQTGLHAWHRGLSNEGFEQGFAIGEFIPDKQRRDIVGLSVADSKGIRFERKPEGRQILQKGDGDHDWRELKLDPLVYWSIHNENQNPYGTPLFRSCEFMAQILATMHNSLANVWERFGDPSYSVIYKTSKKDGANHKERREQMAEDLNEAVRAKRAGKSADFVHAIDTNSEINIDVIGSNGQELQLEVPSRHVLEQIVCKTNLPPWMLGMHWSTTERLAEFELELVLADIKTRQAAKLPIFNKTVTKLLNMRGRSWKKGDWFLEFEQVNLHDIEKLARARFLNSQADMMGTEQEQPAGDPEKKTAYQVKGGKGCGCKTVHGIKEIHRTDHWPALDKVEDEYEAALKHKWAELRDQVKGILGLGIAAAVKAPDDPAAFVFSTEQRARVLSALKGYIGDLDPTAPDSVVAWYYQQAYSLGLIQAAELIGQARPILDIIKNKEISDTLIAEGFTLVKNNATKSITQKIMTEMEAYAIAGSNPVEVAARLEKLFGDANSDWERLARSEMSMAAETAKLQEWAAWEIKMIEFSPAPDACPICTALAGDYPIEEAPIPVSDTHPRCRCANRPAASEVG